MNQKQKIIISGILLLHGMTAVAVDDHHTSTTGNAIVQSTSGLVKITGDTGVDITATTGVITFTGAISISSLLGEPDLTLAGKNAAILNAVGGGVIVNGGAGDGTGVGGAITETAGAGGATTGAGGAVTITAGVGGATGAGGVMTLTAGAGGSTNGPGGAVSITGGAALASGVGGKVSIAGGTSLGAFSGGNVEIIGGNGKTLGSGIGGDVIIKGGNHDNPSGATGSVAISTQGSSGPVGSIDITAGICAGPGGTAGKVAISGGAGSVPLSVHGGAVEITGGNANGNGRTGGGVTITGGQSLGGFGGATTMTGGVGGNGQVGGDASVIGGFGGNDGFGGAVLITGGTAGTAAGIGGAVLITGGAGSVLGAGGIVSITAGTSAAASSNGSDVNITASSGTATNGSGGDVVITAGNKVGIGTNGDVILKGQAGTTANAHNVNLLSLILHVLMSARIAPAATISSNINFANFDNVGVSNSATFDLETITLTIDRFAGTLTTSVTAINGATAITGGATRTIGDGSVTTVTTGTSSKKVYIAWENNGIVSVTAFGGYAITVDSSAPPTGTYAASLSAFTETGVSTTAAFKTTATTSNLVLTYNTLSNDISISGTGLSAISGTLKYGGTATAVIDSAGQNDVLTLTWNDDGSISVVVTP